MIAQPVQSILLRALSVLVCAMITFSQAQCHDRPITTALLVLKNGTRILYETPPDELSHLTNNFIQQWLELNVCAIEAYYGRFPLKELTLTLKAVGNSSEIGYGQAMPGEMPRLTIYVGTKTPPEGFRSSWVMCHEMTHITFPSLDREHRWLEEGIATYVEPIARAMTGIIPVESVWFDLVSKTPEAFANAASGLDGVRDFRRVYWGGALFCLRADIEIRLKTANKHSLQEVLQIIMKREGTMNEDRDILTVLRTGDKYIGASILEKLYLQMGKTAYKPDLEKLWLDLGIERTGGTVIFHDKAPLAAIRKSICSRSAASCNDLFFQKK